MPSAQILPLPVHLVPGPAATGAWVASALAVLSLRGERIAGADYFLTAGLLQRWGDDSSVDGAEMFARFGLTAAIS